MGFDMTPTGGGIFWSVGERERETSESRSSFFFFSSRRRHTRFDCDWSSDVCSSDLGSRDTCPSTADLVGDAAHPAAYSAHDAKYLYFRYRLDANPASKGGFVQNIWSALVQIPSGNPKQYQYEIAVNGKSDALELWANTSATDLSFDPVFNDGGE